MGEKLRKPETRPAWEMEERKAPVSLSYPHTEPRGELTVHKDVPCTHKHTQTNTCMSVEASFCCFFFSLSLHNTARTDRILLQTTVRHVCLPLQHNTERDERQRGEEEEKRGVLFKEPVGRNLCGCGRNTPSFTGFFLLQRGSRGPHNHCLIITSKEGRCVLGGMHRRRERKQERRREELWKKTRKCKQEIYL